MTVEVVELLGENPCRPDSLLLLLTSPASYHFLRFVLVFAVFTLELLHWRTDASADWHALVKSGLLMHNRKNLPNRRTAGRRMVHGPGHHPIPINAGEGGSSDDNNDGRDQPVAHLSTHSSVATAFEEEYVSTATSSSLVFIGSDTAAGDWGQQQQSTILNNSAPAATKNWSGEPYDPMSIA